MLLLFLIEVGNLINYLIFICWYTAILWIIQSLFNILKLNDNMILVIKFWWNILTLKLFNGHLIHWLLPFGIGWALVLMHLSRILAILIRILILVVRVKILLRILLLILILLTHISLLLLVIILIVVIVIHTENKNTKEGTKIYKFMVGSKPNPFFF